MRFESPEHGHGDCYQCCRFKNEGSRSLIGENEVDREVMKRVPRVN